MDERSMLTHPPLNAPMGFLAGRGETSWSLRAEVVNVRREVEVRRLIAGERVREAIVKEVWLRGCQVNVTELSPFVNSMTGFDMTTFRSFTIVFCRDIPPRNKLKQLIQSSSS